MHTDRNAEANPGRGRLRRPHQARPAQAAPSCPARRRRGPLTRSRCPGHHRSGRGCRSCGNRSGRRARGRCRGGGPAGRCPRRADSSRSIADDVDDHRPADTPDDDVPLGDRRRGAHGGRRPERRIVARPHLQSERNREPGERSGRSCDRRHSLGRTHRRTPRARLSRRHVIPDPRARDRRLPRARPCPPPARMRYAGALSERQARAGPRPPPAPAPAPRVASRPGAPACAPQHARDGRGGRRVSP